MLNKAFLYINDYPRNSRDVPFDLAIDWGDGSPVVQYNRLVVDRLPPFHHLYADSGTYDIQVTITNHCGSATRIVTHTPFFPPDCECANAYALEPGSIFTAFDQEPTVPLDLRITGCTSNIRRVENNLIAVTLVTDVSSNIPLAVLLPKETPLLDGVFSLQSDTVEVVESLRAHLDQPNGTIPTIVNAPEVDFVYDFNTLHVSELRLRGDSNFRDRVGNTVNLDDGTVAILTWGQVADGLNSLEAVIPVGRSVNSIRLGLAQGPRAMFRGLRLDNMNQASRQLINVQARPFLHQESFVQNLDLAVCRTHPQSDVTWSQLPSAANVLRWRAETVPCGGTTAILEIPVKWDGGDHMVEFDFWWQLNPERGSGWCWCGQSQEDCWCGYYNNEAETFFYLGGLNAPLQINQPHSEDNVYLQLARRESSTGMATFRTPLHGGIPRIKRDEENVFLLYVGGDHSWDGSQVELQGVRLIESRGDKLTGGMHGTITYRSEIAHAIKRIDVVCCANAKARLQTEGFEDHWREEDTHDATFWRGSLYFDTEETIDRFSLAFSGADSEGNFIGDGVIRAVEFFEALDTTKYEPPISVRFAVLGGANEQRNTLEGIFHYIDAGGRHHCVAINTVRFTQSEFNQLVNDPIILTAVRLETERGGVTATVAGVVNPACMQIT